VVLNKDVQTDLTEIIAITGIKNIQKLEKIWRTEVYSFETSDATKYIIKNIGPVSEDKLIRYKFCHQVIRHLYEKKEPVFLPLTDKEGNDILVHKDHLYVIRSFVQHEPCVELNDISALNDILFNIGNSLALLHKSLEDFPDEKLDEKVWRAPLNEEMINWRSSQLLSYLDDTDRKRVEPVLNIIVPQMNDAFRELKEQLIHRDFHLGNILLKNKKVAAYIDADHFSIGPRILDVGYFLNSLLKFHPEGFLEPEEWIGNIQPFLKGYSAQITMGQIEKDALCLAIVSIPMGFVGWCYEVGMDELGRSMLIAMEWMYEHMDEIEDSIKSVIKLDR
jgi:Ser/Thr protein kinase RdoA (MazF antagonist)